MALSKIDLANMVENDLAAGSQPLTIIENKINFRNIFINGDMSIAQRGTSATGLTNGSNGYHTIDRFRFGEQNVPTFVFTQTQDTTVPTGQGFSKSLKMDVTTAQSSLGTAGLRLQQRFEGQNLQYLKKGTSSAESLTLSFWVRSNKTGTYICELQDSDNSRHISKSYTISSADTWEKKTITYDGDTTGAFDNDNANSLEVSFWLCAGTDYSSGTLATSWSSITDANRAVGQVNLADSTSNEWYITGVQLEVGTAASDFEFLPTDVNLNRCLRYFYKHTGSNAYYCAYSSNDAYNIYENMFHVEMRAAPTVTTTDGAGWSASNPTKQFFATYRSPKGNYTPPDYNAEAEL